MAKIVKGEARGKPGRWIVDFYDSFGKRRWRVCRTKQEAEAVLAEVIRESRQPARPVVNPEITVADYATRWLTQLTGLKPRSIESTTRILRCHLLPAFGPLKVRQLTRGSIKTFLGSKLKAGYAKNTVGLLLSVLRALLNAAVEDGVILANPAVRLGRALRLLTPPSARQEQIKAMTREELRLFLETARAHPHAYIRRCFPLLLLMSRTGLRVGEALALQWQDINWRDRSLRVARAFSAGQVETPKSGHGRDVDLSQQTVEVLRRLEVKRKAETLRRGWGELPTWVFPNTHGEPMDPKRVRQVFGRVLRAAGLRGHFSPHSLRHTYASLLLQHGESPAYVQRQLGHASIKLTVDTYGRWLPMGNTAAVDRLDDPGRPAISSVASADPVSVATGSQPVAKIGSHRLAAGGGVVQLLDFAEASGGTRSPRPLSSTNGSSLNRPPPPPVKAGKNR